MHVKRAPFLLQPNLAVSQFGDCARRSELIGNRSGDLTLGSLRLPRQKRFSFFEIAKSLCGRVFADRLMRTIP
jgi:hypothetical protein